MRAPSSMENEFLKKLIMGLKFWNSTRKKMTILERKKAIKLSADIAMASTRNGMTCWSRAIVSKASNDDENEAFLEHMLGSETRLRKVSSIGRNITNTKRVRSKKILKKSRRNGTRARRWKPQTTIAKSIAREMIDKRRQILKSLIPGGGELMDDFSLIEETLDYVVFLRAEVDGMRTLAKAIESLRLKQDELLVLASSANITSILSRICNMGKIQDRILGGANCK